MKITPMSSQGVTVGSISAGNAEPQSMVQKIRSLKMNTNATPGRVEESIPLGESASALTIPNDNKDVTAAPSEETQPLSPQFAALAKQRRALQVKEREVADREKALASKSSIPEDAISAARLKSDPLGVLLESGVTYEQLTASIIANQNGFNPELQEMKAKLKALEEGVDKRFTDRETQAEQQALAEMRKEAVLLTAQGEDFELVRETESIQDVMKLIERTYRKTGEVLDVREAVQLVEDELLKEGLKIANLKKVHGQLLPQQPVLQPQQQQRQQMKTLTNRDTASVPLSRKARALAAFTGTLKT